MRSVGRVLISNLSPQVDKQLKSVMASAHQTYGYLPAIEDH